MTNGNQLTLEEVVNSLNGYEEDAIEKHFGAQIDVLLETRATRALRALLYVVAKRRGLDEKAAKAEVMSLSVKELDAGFATETVGEDPDEPESEQGKEPSELA